MNRALFAHTWRANRLRLLVVTIALVLWGALLPIVYDAFGEQFEQMLDSGLIPEEFTNFGGGDVFSLVGSVSLGFVHPLAVGLCLVFALGFAVNAIAGERQRGTLEVLLARPISRRRVYATLAVAAFLFVGVTVAGLALGAFAGSALTGRAADLGASNLPLVWLNAFLLYGAIAAISLAASVAFDRLGPAIAVSLAIVLFSYFLDVIGQIWPRRRAGATAVPLPLPGPARVPGRRAGVERLRGAGRGHRRRRCVRPDRLPATRSRRADLSPADSASVTPSARTGRARSPRACRHRPSRRPDTSVCARPGRRRAPRTRA